jgi:hypothetical protein
LFDEKRCDTLQQAGVQDEAEFFRVLNIIKA